MPLDSMMADLPGWYGKLSTLGDFVQRRLSDEFVRVGDAWLSAAMNESRRQLGGRWLEVYLTAPVLRFAWAPGIVDVEWRFGVLMPSCDNVGRYFPLLIAQRRGRPPLDQIALDHLEAWFDHLADAAKHTLGDGASIDSFEQALADAPPWPTPSATSAAPVAHPIEGGGKGYRLGLRETPGQWLHGMAAETLQARLAGCSLWWRPGDRGAGLAPSGQVVRGLPDPAGFAALLTGG